MPYGDAVLEIPIVGESPPPSEESEEMPIELGSAANEMLTTHALNGAQRQADGAAAYAENLRYNYLEGKDNTSQAEALGHRIASESGSGRTRVESNRPEATSGAGG